MIKMNAYNKTRYNCIIVPKKQKKSRPFCKDGFSIRIPDKHYPRISRWVPSILHHDAIKVRLP